MTVIDKYGTYNFSDNVDDRHIFSRNISTCTYDIVIGGERTKLFAHQIKYASNYYYDLSSNEDRYLRTPPNDIWGPRKLSTNDTISVKKSEDGQCVEGETIFTWKWMNLSYYHYSEDTDEYLSFYSTGRAFYNFTINNHTEEDHDMLREYEPGKFISHACGKDIPGDVQEYKYYSDICDLDSVHSLKFDKDRYKYLNSEAKATLNITNYVSLYELFMQNLYFVNPGAKEVQRVF